MKHVKLLIFSALMIVLYTNAAFADEDSNLDMILGLGYVTHPHYFGSNQAYGLIAPAAKAVMANFEFEREGAKVTLFRNDKNSVTFGLDFGARVPVTSAPLDATIPAEVNNSETMSIQGQNYTRRGMRDLPLILMPGAKLSWRMADYIILDLPILNGFEIDSNFGYVGMTFSPIIEFRPLQNTETELATGVYLRINPIFGDSNYNRYYYEVTQADVLADRPEYHPSAGLTMINYELATLWNVKDNWWLFFGIYLHDMTNTSVSDSPLVVSKRGYSLVFQVMRDFYRGPMSEFNGNKSLVQYFKSFVE